MTKEEFLERIDDIMCGTSNAERAYLEGLYYEVTKPHWISVKERLPEEGIYVATLDNGGRNDIRHFYNGKWFGRFGNEYRGITHWLPLPAPIVIPKDDALPEEGMSLPAPLSCSVFPNNHKKGTVSNSERVAVISKTETVVTIAKKATVDAPLTAEILLKNGFKPRKQGGEMQYILTEDYYDVYVTEYLDGWWFVEYEDSERGGLPTERIAVRNVHQLQGAFKLFGVVKGIEL